MARLPRLPILVIAAILVASACTASEEAGVTVPGGGGTSPLPGTEAAATTAGPSAAGRDPAPEFPDGLDWVNTGRPLSFTDLRGKVVLLDFWTYGCINCIHVIPELERLEAEFPEELVVIGVHSAKFTTEAATENIREVVVRYGLEHPVINDADFRVWREWGVRAWPTLVLVDPAGNVVGAHAGEGVYPVFEPVVRSLIAEFDARGAIDRTPLDLDLERDSVPDSVLSFPGKVLADPAGGRIFVADTNHHRVIVADPATGEVLDVAGTGARGYEDGPFTGARFDRPQGMALSEDGTILYVADQGSHSIRALDFTNRSVATLTGTGEKAFGYPPSAGPAPEVALSSPWDLELVGDRLYIAMAGSHQIWVHDFDSGISGPIAGSGTEGTFDGIATAAELAQPSGLAYDAARGRLYFADAESSSIRYLEPALNRTGLLAGSGEGLFDFGDEDGAGTGARFQHPLGVAFDGASLYVADTYNSKIKRIDPETGETTTFLGGESGWEDGDDPRFSEPGGIDVVGRTLYVADTNNDAIRVVDLDTGTATTLVLYGIERFETAEDGFDGTVVRLDPASVSPGPGRVVLDVSLPAGYKVNDLAPFSMSWRVEGGVADLEDADRSVVAPYFPLFVAATFSPGSGMLTADVTIYFCTEEAEQLCLIDRVRLEAPVEVGQGEDVLTLSYDVPPPPLLGG